MMLYIEKGYSRLCKAELELGLGWGYSMLPLWGLLTDSQCEAQRYAMGVRLIHT